MRGSAVNELNGLEWNPLKSQLLRMLLNVQPTQHTTTNTTKTDIKTDTVRLNEAVVKSCEEADYLGLIINTRRGFICKDAEVLRNKGKTATMLITKEKCFSLTLHPKYFVNIYLTHDTLWQRGSNKTGTEIADGLR